MDSNLWPSNPRSRTVDPHVDWPMVAPDRMSEATPALIRACTRNQLMLLRDRNPLLWELMSEECIEAASAIIEGRKEERKKPVAKAGGSKKDELLAKLAAIMDEAEADRDLGAQLKTVEMEAKLEALLSTKPREDTSSIASRMIEARRRINGL